MPGSLKENLPYLPKEHDVALAKQSIFKLSHLIQKKKKKDFHIRIAENRHEEILVLPFSALQLLLGILTQMAEGNAVTIIPIHAELTTQEAANILHVSRPYLISLLEKGEIPFRKVGTHRRIYFSDLVEFKNKLDKTSSKALDELTKQAQELGLGY
jgi:excisionase family DNA binding protein